jgi:hypothetical protein
MLTEVERKFGRTIPTALFWHSPTVENLAALADRPMPGLRCAVEMVLRAMALFPGLPLVNWDLIRACHPGGKYVRGLDADESLRPARTGDSTVGAVTASVDSS